MNKNNNIMRKKIIKRIKMLKQTIVICKKYVMNINKTAKDESVALKQASAIMEYRIRIDELKTVLEHF